LPALYILLAALFCLNLLWSKPVYAGMGLGIVALGGVVYFFRRKGEAASAGDQA
jgi:hypothetical protein